MGKLQHYRAKFINRFFTELGREKARIKKLPRYTEGYARLFGRKFLFHDSESFLVSYKEIFENEIYRFHSSQKKWTILDCGANIGLSVLFFSYNYPDHKIIAFEPDESVFHLLQQNVRTYNLHNVQLMRTAVWDAEETQEFYTDHGMGGRIGTAYKANRPSKVSAVRLRNFLNEDIDFLKMDIEGAEYRVLSDCSDLLGKVNHLFFEYHGHYSEPQNLHELLSLLTKNNFHYYLKESSTRKRPFIDEGLLCEVYDMAMNVFGYRPTNFTKKEQ
ncbi:MAG: FkbM family methyltransferase [Flavisolibacter sp.]